MYQIENSGQVIKSRKSLAFGRLRRLRVSRVVLFLGLTSFFTDISSEMISTVLPIYLIFALHLAPIEFGIVDGLYQGAAALVRVASGIFSDRSRRYKEVAVAGYGLSAICKIGFLAVGGAWAWIAGIILIDRIGKGIRTSPRDALISLSSPQAELATAFGVHRALDTAGAMLGPLLAFGLLALTPGAFDSIFVVSFCIALIGLGVLTLFVEQQPAEQRVMAESAVSLRAAMGLLRGTHFRALVLISGLLGITTISDSFLYLNIQQRLDLNIGFFPLLYVITALIYMLLAVPAGWLADRVGRGRVFVGGYVLLLAVYTLLLLPSVGWIELVIYLALFGAYYSATDGVLMALASAGLPEHLRASGLSLLTTVTGLARLLASVLFGMFWSLWGVDTTVRVFLGLLLVTLVIAIFVVARIQRISIDA
jgi:MFS family permease